MFCCGKDGDVIQGAGVPAVSASAGVDASTAAAGVGVPATGVSGGAVAAGVAAGVGVPAPGVSGGAAAAGDPRILTQDVKDIVTSFIEKSKKIVLLVGCQGSGKTTLLDMLVFAKELEEKEDGALEEMKKKFEDKWKKAAAATTWHKEIVVKHEELSNASRKGYEFCELPGQGSVVDKLLDINQELLDRVEAVWIVSKSTELDHVTYAQTVCMALGCRNGVVKLKNLKELTYVITHTDLVNVENGTKWIKFNQHHHVSAAMGREFPGQEIRKKLLPISVKPMSHDVDAWDHFYLDHGQRVAMKLIKDKL